MTLLAPAWLWAAVVAAGAVTLLHFFARQRPRPAAFPTARFVPDVAARAPSAARRPTDLLLLALRVLALLAAGLAFARPSLAPDRRPVARVVVLADTGVAARDSAVRYLEPGDTLIDSPTLSAALIQAVRASASLRDRADSLELVIIATFAESQIDAATDSIRAQWLGRARLVRLATPEAEPARRIEFIGSADDPLRATVQLLGLRSGAVTRLVRGVPGAADSAFAQGGGVLVVWPSETPAGLSSDTVGAVVAGEVVVVAPFIRPSRIGPPVPRSPGPRAIAHWVDGAPAAIEYTYGSGVIREVVIPVPVVGDLVLRQSMRDLVDILTATRASCASCASADSTQLSRLRRTGRLLPARLAPEPLRAASRWSAWLLAAAGLLLILEHAARPRVVRA